MRASGSERRGGAGRAAVAGSSGEGTLQPGVRTGSPARLRVADEGGRGAVLAQRGSPRRDGHLLLPSSCPIPAAGVRSSTRLGFNPRVTEAVPAEIVICNPPWQAAVWRSSLQGESPEWLGL